MKTKWLLILVLALFTQVLQGQEGSKDLVLSLEEAQEYALQHNKMIKSSKLNVQASKMSTWEAISAGLPQVDGSASLTDNLKLATMLMPDFFGDPTQKIEIQFGSQFNAGYGVQVSQLLFNASYFVGVQTAKLAESLSVQDLEKSELDIKEAIISTYYLILISEESIEVLDDNLDNLNETLEATKAMFKVGMAEATDVDQMQSTVTMVANSKRSMERNVEVSYNLMRFQLGLDPEAGIKLTQTLDDFIEEVNVTVLSMQEFNIQNNINYRLIQSQEKFGELSVKMQKSTVLPTLVGFYTYNQSGMGDELGKLDWFPNSMMGVSVNVPIFASGMRYSKIKRAEIDLEQIRTTKSLVADQLLIEEKQLKYNLINANEQFVSKKENIEVANRVFVSVENKYKQGMASSLDLTQAHNNYLQAVSDYTSSFMSLLQTKLSLDKLMNNL